MKENHEVNYDIVKFDCEIDEEEIRKIICDKNNKNKLLKSIFVDKVNQNQKICYLIFEEINSETKIEYDYLIVQLNKLNDSNEEFMKDLARKLNELNSSDYKICLIFSDEDKMFFILISELTKSGNAEEECEM